MLTEGGEIRGRYGLPEMDTIPLRQGSSPFKAVCILRKFEILQDGAVGDDAVFGDDEDAVADGDGA